VCLFWQGHDTGKAWRLNESDSAGEWRKKNPIMQYVGVKRGE
jgi:hypothetical protein